MLVDRILTIEGEPLSMTSGRVVTEHDIHPGAWYLDCGRIPTCIAVESGQADLFLSGWLGIDFETKGLASYRLLDAVVTFHDALPGPGQVIHYDIKVLNFFRQGSTYLFRFEFDATVDGKPLLTMREGCAGFFTEAELAGGKGVIHTALDKRPRPGARPADWSDPIPMSVESYDDRQLLALRRGDLAGCFGPAFARLPLQEPVTLPGLPRNSNDQLKPGLERSRMWLIDRVLKLDPSAGKFGMGTILGELDIHPDDWFLTCHFCDDQVMPGTLMYECCLHTLRIYLLRMGWIGETGSITYEPIVEIRSRLKCRGQVLAGTKKVWYEVTLKEVGYGKDEGSSAYCLADALMYADGKPIVEITDMSVQLTGLTKEAVERLWARQPVTSTVPAGPQYDRQPAIFDTDRITAFAIGKPSDAFGDRYIPFDEQRKIARLPGPPFQFLDRVVSIKNCEPWVLLAGGEIVAQYDVPVDAWYFASNRQRTMPFAVLLETALQPCGWLAGYLGSALTSDTDLSFRNLGGTATQYRDVTPQSGTLSTTVRMTRVSNSAGMIIQHYDFDLRCEGEPVYVGNTYFGFFSKAALSNQIGIRDATPYQPTPQELAVAKRGLYPQERPFSDDQFRMIQTIEGLVPNGGPYGKGCIVGTTPVDPSTWFFKAHFYQDPVVPGSLGLESFWQLLKVFAADRWQLGSETEFSTPVCDSAAQTSKHEWVYRGQVVPADKMVTVTAVIREIDDNRRTLTAEGYLTVDGRVIYQMKNFTLGCQ
jgi:3-hydroxymyristoyl/3-hydroxydecanoyl-(acyl carrier protein) dehydratase